MRALKTISFVLFLLLALLLAAQGKTKTNYAYTANYSTANVSVIDTSNNTVAKTISVGVNPWGVAVNQAGTFAYVTNISSNSVSVISTKTNAVVATIPVGSLPTGIAVSPSGKTAYVSNTGGQTVSVINTGTKKVTATVTVQSSPTGLTVTPNGAYVYVANAVGNSVSVISTLTNAVVATLPVGSGPAFVPISPDGRTAYAINNGTNNVSVIRTADNTVVNTISVSAGPYGAAVSPDSHWLYIAHVNAHTGNLVTVIDTSTQTVKGTIVVGTGPFDVSFSQDSAFAYVASYDAENVAVINTASRTVVNTIPLGTTPSGVGVMGTMKVSTVAGGFVGDKGSPTNAAMNSAYGSVLDSAGNLFVSDVEAHRIRKITPGASSTITTYAGTGICGYNGEGVKANKAMLCGPNGLTLDSSGNLIVADGGAGRIVRIDHKTTQVTTIAGNGVFGYNPGDDGGPALKAAISQVFHLAYDTLGNLYFDSVGDCVVRKVDTSGILSTVAGTGVCGYNGDGIPAKTAELNLPRGVVVDSSGNVYIGDTVNHRVRKVDGSGTITTFAGTGQNGIGCNGGLANTSNVGNPRGLTIFNNVLYVGNGGPRMCAVDLATNLATTFAGSFNGYDGDGHSLTTSEFEIPTFVLFDGSGNPIIDDGLNGRVRKATGGILQTIVGGAVNDGAKATAAAFGLAEALTFDKQDNFYIADTTGNRIRKVSASGGVIGTVAGNGISGFSGDTGPGPSAMLNEPQGVAVDSAGNVFIADTSNDVIREVKTDGNIYPFAADSRFSFLLQMATDSANNLYAADDGACVIWKITPAGVVSIFAGVLNTCGYNGDGITATTAQLGGPYGVAFDSSGNMFIADSGGNRIREVNTSNIISTVAGDGNCNFSGDGGSATAAELCPNSVAVDKSNNIFVADLSSDRIRKISGGVITSYAGTAYGFNGDKLWPLYTAFDDPVAVAVDSNNAVYVLDDSNHLVRKIQ